MMYRIDIHISTAHYKKMLLDVGVDQRAVENTNSSIYVPYDCKDAEEVQTVIPKLLDMFSEAGSTPSRLLSYDSERLF